MQQMAKTRPKAWLMLALGLSAQTVGTVFVNAPAFLIPLLHQQDGLPLAQAGLLASAPTVGTALTLIAWGALADRYGERWVITAGLALTALAALGAVLVPGYIPLGLFGLAGGMASASCNAASGRLVVGWFPRHQRGLAMGIRQMAVPLGTAIAALTVPTVADASGIGPALMVPLVLTAAAAVSCGLWISDPPRATTSAHPEGSTANPYRASSFLWRIHAVSVLLVVPQLTLTIFGLVWLIADVRLDSVLAGAIVGGAQLVGALGRIAVGVWSDRLGSRVRLLRWVAVAGLVTMPLITVADAMSLQVVATVAFVAATVVSVADNGLAFTSVAEAAGPRWSGKALGTQNTGQFLAAAGVGPGVGALVGLLGYPLAYLMVAAAPLAAIPLIPERDVHAEG
ncbi:MFS transporter [Sinomonas gamaensis]|uniref:MFS transporter n=1 Tax=Sinomonas gamaensis TaxID=2565624 RepID=UPI0020165790|nr:MFS transporter [Sinomonas gamaensis]